ACVISAKAAGPPRGPSVRSPACATETPATRAPRRWPREQSRDGTSSWSPAPFGTAVVAQLAVTQVEDEQLGLGEGVQEPARGFPAEHRSCRCCRRGRDGPSSCWSR